MTHQGDVGGSTNSITWLSRGLAERGHEVFLACRPESLIAGRFANGPARTVELRLGRGAKLLSHVSRWKKWIDRERIDVVNANASLDRHLVSYLRLAGCHASLVHTRRNVALSTGGRTRAWFDTCTTDAIVAVSREVGEDLVRRGVPRAHVCVIPNGIPLAELPAADPVRVERLRAQLDLRAGVPVVGVVARRKSQGDLLRAAELLGRPLEILCVGAEEDEELASLARRIPAAARARFLGFRDDVADLSALFDVFVLPSEIEGFSLALLEAMARSLPCIATDAGGNREALDEGAGIVVPPRDPAAIAAALARLLDDRAAARAMGARARARVFATFDVARTVERTEALYSELHGARTSRGR